MYESAVFTGIFNGMRVGIVTGASRGIGAEFAKELRRVRPDLDEIWCISRTGSNSFPRLATEGSSTRKPRFRVLNLDQSASDFADKLRICAEQHNAEIVYLILNAAQANYGAINTQYLADADQMIQTNIRGSVAAVYSLKNSFEEGSRIILVSSISALAPTPGLAIYTATKAFIRHWGLSLREEMKPQGVTVTICYPGKVGTRALRDVVKQSGSGKLRLIPNQNPRYLVRQSLRAAERGRAEVAPGVYGLVKALFKVLPTRVVVRLASLVRG